ncbi:hypothetical protein [Kiloniella sp. b19]|uniref:hypothetical protein n=1 Tax=Kiloniella sp. GXU_MW_B19 TaxID=3141326 RepID=UPI0031E34632
MVQNSRLSETSGQENILLDFITRISRAAEGRIANVVHLSKLHQDNQKDYHIRIIKNILEDLATRFEGAIFTLSDKDLVLITKNATVNDIEEVIARVRGLFSDDPFFAGNPELAADAFCSWYDLVTQIDEFHTMAEEKATEAARAKARERSELLGAKALDGQNKKTTPIRPEQLESLSKAIKQADLTAMMKRQNVYLVSNGGKPEPLFKELFFSIETLQTSLTPNHDLLANRWLFQELTRHLDRRMLAILAQNDDSSLKRAYSMNINVDSILSDSFLKFDETLREEVRKSIIIELQATDIFSDLGNFFFARDFLHERGYKLCLDGMCHRSLALIDRQKIGVDLVKMKWDPDLSRLVRTKRGDDLRQTIQDTNPERVILCRCGSQEALEVGQSFGIKLFQGYYLDKLGRS